MESKSGSKSIQPGKRGVKKQKGNSAGSVAVHGEVREAIVGRYGKARL